MKDPAQYIKALQRRLDYLKALPNKNSYTLAEIGALEWALLNLPRK